MNESLEFEIAETLRPYEGGTVDVIALRAGALSRARRVQRRRFALASAGLAIAMAGITTAAVAVAPRVDDVGSVAVPRPPQPSTAGLVVGVTTRLPKADVPGAAQRPDTVGTDPGVLHFDVDWSALGATGLAWRVASGVESLAVWTGDVNHYTLWYDLARDRNASRRSIPGGSAAPEATNPATVLGRPAILERYPKLLGGPAPVWALTWQPVDGLWATVVQTTDSSEEVFSSATALRLDKPQRCTVPLRLTALSRKVTWTGCNAMFGPYKPWEVGGLEFAYNGGAGAGALAVSIGRLSVDDPFVANRTVNGRPARLTTAAPGGPEPTGTVKLVVPITDWVALTVSTVPQWGSGSPAATTSEPVHALESDIIALAEAVIVSTDFIDPASWPARPVP